MELKPEEITVDTLDQVAVEWEDMRLGNLVRENVRELSSEFLTMRQELSLLETRCMLRARKLAMLGHSKKEIQDLFGVSRSLINRWLKGMF